MTQETTTKRPLVFRLSSVGDVVLATSALQAPLAQDGVDWVVSKELADLLRGHPNVAKIWEFDRKTGLGGWIELCRKLWIEQYEAVFDLHSTVRTGIARVLFFLWSWRASREATTGDGPLYVPQGPIWRRVPKERWRSYGYFVFKKLWPKKFRPRPWVERFAQTLGGSGKERPSLTHLLEQMTAQRPLASEAESFLSSNEKYICVMPGSRWAGKRWPVTHYSALLSAISASSQDSGKAAYVPVILGTPGDGESLALVGQLKKRGIRHVSAVGNYGFPQVARILRGAEAYLGSDTGLAHLAEALGVPAWMILGPTIQDMGFGPWRRESGVIGSELWCRPCGKDGRACFRLSGRHACMKQLSPGVVMKKIRGSAVMEGRSQ